MELFVFDKAYVDRLRDGEPATEQHFASYFGRLLGIMLRARYLSPERVDDIRQETLTRVIAILRREGGVHYPERFGAFVNSICKNVLREHARDWSRTQSIQKEQADAPQKIMDLERAMISEEAKQTVRQILEELKPRDRQLLSAMFLQEKDKDEICNEFGVDRQYLRVLLYRAKERFRSTFEHMAPGRPTRTLTGKLG